MQHLSFKRINNKQYPCLQLAIAASYHSSQIAVITLNTTNEIAVEAFSSEKISFTSIPLIIKKVLDKSIQLKESSNVEEVFLIDKKALLIQQL